jgi:hypothetical protein
MVFTYRSCRITYRSHIQGASKEFSLGCLALECETDRLFRNVGNYQPRLRNMPEERKTYLHRGGGSLKLRTFLRFFPGVHRLLSRKPSRTCSVFATLAILTAVHMSITVFQDVTLCVLPGTEAAPSSEF